MVRFFKVVLAKAIVDSSVLAFDFIALLTAADDRFAVGRCSLAYYLELD